MLGHCRVSSPSLTRLVIRLENDQVRKFGINLDSPALRYLQLFCLMPGELSVGSLDSLIEANIDLVWHDWEQDNLIYSRYVLALVSKMYNVRRLRMSTCRISVIRDSAFFASAVKFQNLTKLDLKLFSNWSLMTSFLENANNLRALYLRIWEKIGVDNEYGWVEPKRVPACLISHVGTVVVFYFQGSSEHEFDMVRYVLMNAKVLKKMDIQIHHLECDHGRKPEIIKRISSFEKGSQECELVFD